MNIAIVGRSRINRLLAAELTKAGLTPVLVEQLVNITGLEGEKGAFTLAAGENRIAAGHVIITEELEFKRGLTGTPLENTPYISLLGLTDFENLANPVVILLDYPCETPAFLGETGFEKAVILAKKRRNVLFLAKSLRAAGAGLETRYLEARRNGVSFIKYQELAIHFDGAANRFQLQVSDEYGEYVVKPGVLIVADRVTAGEPLKKIARLFRLHLNEQGRLNGTESFLYPTRTSRPGISVINNGNGIYEHANLDAHLQYIIAEIKSPINEPNPKHAEVDPQKCAFCFNCYRSCPHAAMAPDYENSAMKNLTKSCHGCGICVTICPAAAITIITGNNCGFQAKAGAKRLKVFCCDNSGAIAVKEATAGRAPEEFDLISVTTMACGGEFSLEHLYSALRDYRRVLVLTCMDGACQHFAGNKLAWRLVQKAREQLKAAGLDENRVQYEKVSLGMPKVVEALIKSYAF